MFHVALQLLEKKSGIGAVLSEQSSFAEVGINRRRALRILSRINI
jgi:hypothetical protein